MEFLLYFVDKQSGLVYLKNREWSGKEIFVLHCGKVKMFFNPFTQSFNEGFSWNHLSKILWIFATPSEEVNVDFIYNQWFKNGPIRPITGHRDYTYTYTYKNLRHLPICVSIKNSNHLKKVKSAFSARSYPHLTYPQAQP